VNSGPDGAQGEGWAPPPLSPPRGMDFEVEDHGAVRVPPPRAAKTKGSGRSKESPEPDEARPFTRLAESIQETLARFGTTLNQLVERVDRVERGLKPIVPRAPTILPPTPKLGSNRGGKKRKTRVGRNSLPSVASAETPLPPTFGVFGSTPRTSAVTADVTPAPRGPRVTSNVSLPQDQWVTVVKRKGRGKGRKQGIVAPVPPDTPLALPPTRGGRTPANSSRGKATPKAKTPPLAIVRRRLPKTAAIMVSAKVPSEGLADILQEARSRINIDDLGISNLKVRRSQNGGLLLEVPGVDAGNRVAKLANQMREVVGHRANISVPCKTLDLRLRDVDLSVQPCEVASAISAAGGCLPSEVRVGVLQPAPGGLRTVWVKCPARAACKVATMGGLTIGWSRARATVLPTRPQRCYRCLARGHVQQRCPSEQDRHQCCYRCGKPGHHARACRDKPHCPICAVRRLPVNHTPGSDKCRPVPPRAFSPRKIAEVGEGETGAGDAGPSDLDPATLPLPDNSAEDTPPTIPPPGDPIDPGDMGEEKEEAMSVVSEATAEKRAREAEGDSPPSKRQA